MKASGRRPYASPLRAEQAEQTRERIVLAAVELLSERESGELSMPEVATRANVSVRTVYRSFRTRDELLDGVIGWISERLSQRVGPPPSSPASYVAATPEVIAALFEIEPLYRALFATAAGRESHRRRGQPKRHEEILGAFSAQLEGMPANQAKRFGALLNLVSSSNGALFLKDYWGLDPAEVGQAMQWAIRTLADAASDPERRSGL